MISRVDGSASLSARRTYLRRRRSDRLGPVATWTLIGVAVVWLTLAALSGLIH